MIERGVVKAEAKDIPGVWLAWSERGLRAAWWEGDDAGGFARAPMAVVPPAWERLLKAYLGGDPVDLSVLPVDLQGTAFQKRVWEALRRIPRGELRTYGEIARALGSPAAMRAVGGANGANPLPVVVPCHRVIASGGKLGGYSGGLDRKRWLLALEGVSVVGDRVQGREHALAG